MITQWLTRVLNCILDFETILQTFKHSIIVPVHKRKGYDPLSWKYLLYKTIYRKLVSNWILTSVRSLCHYSRLAVNPTSTYKARPLLSKIQSRSWDAGSPPYKQWCLNPWKHHQSTPSILCHISSYTWELNSLSSCHVIDTCVMPILLFGAENWVLTDQLVAKLGILPGRTWKKNHKAVEI